MSRERKHASSAKIGMWTRERSQRCSSSRAAGIGCSMNSTPCDSSHAILRAASSLLFQPSLASTRSVTKKPLRVDANEGWKSKEEAARKIAWLESQGVEFIEQPMPAALLEEQRWLRSRVHMPIFADEACLRSRDIPKVADAYDGIVVKVDKAGGLLEALRSIHTARSFGLKVMLGCMVSSSVAITAAAHLSPLADYADLDGNLLIANDPYRGVLVRDGRLVLPERPGLGLTPVV